jgi:MSHA biogenesis protein MshM
LSNGEGFVKVVGEVGTGKTLLCRKLLNGLGEGYYTAYIPNPYLNPTSLYKALAQELGVKFEKPEGINEIHHSINARLVELVAAGKRVVLIIDEAQTMPEKTLEALRLISNLETETTKLIHIVLFGQPELDRLLALHELRQLRQRVTFSCKLPPLDNEGVYNYIQHRLNTAGYNGEQLFGAKAITLLAQSSRGIPRLINMLCHKSLMCAYGKGVKHVDRQHVMAAINDTEDAALPSFFKRMAWIFSPSILVVGTAYQLLQLCSPILGVIA